MAIFKKNKCPNFYPCADGTYSTKKGRGACSRHGGMLVFEKDEIKAGDVVKVKKYGWIMRVNHAYYEGGIDEKLYQLENEPKLSKQAGAVGNPGGYFLRDIEKIKLTSKKQSKPKAVKKVNIQLSEEEKKEKALPSLPIGKEDNFTLMLDKAKKLVNIINAKIEQGQKGNKNWHLHKRNNTYNIRSTRKAKYIKIDLGTSGKYMLDTTDGRIYGIKGYGQVNKGNRYGLIDEYLNGTKVFKSFEKDWSYMNALQHTEKKSAKPGTPVIKLSEKKLPAKRTYKKKPKKIEIPFYEQNFTPDEQKEMIELGANVEQIIKNEDEKGQKAFLQNPEFLKNYLGYIRYKIYPIEAAKSKKFEDENYWVYNSWYGMFSSIPKWLMKKLAVKWVKMKVPEAKKVSVSFPYYYTFAVKVTFDENLKSEMIEKNEEGYEINSIKAKEINKTVKDIVWLFNEGYYDRDADYGYKFRYGESIYFLYKNYDKINGLEDNLSYNEIVNNYMQSFLKVPQKNNYV